MDKRRLRTRAAVGTALALLTGMPLKAQESAEDYRTIVTIMRACAMIAEVPARVACYDNTVASAGEARTSAAPLTTPLATRPAGGFGAETLPKRGMRIVRGRWMRSNWLSPPYGNCSPALPC